MKLTELQIWPAISLAKSYNHAWAATEIPGADTEEIKKESIARGEWDSAVLAPEIDERGHVVHVTGTGRLEWDIDSGGNTTLEIHRKDVGCVLRLALPRDSWPVDNWPVIEICAPFALRHLCAMAAAAQCLTFGNTELMFALFAPLWARAELDSPNAKVSDGVNNL